MKISKFLGLALLITATCFSFAFAFAPKLNQPIFETSVNNLTYKFTLVKTIGGFGSAKGFFNTPLGITGDGKYLFICDSGNNRIIRYDLFQETFFQFTDLPEDLFGLNSPYDIAILDGNYVLVSDKNNNRLIQYYYDGEYQTSFGELGISSGQFSGPTGIAVNRYGQIFIADSDNNRVQVFEKSVLNKLPSAQAKDFLNLEFGNNYLTNPTSLLVTRFDNIWVADNNSIKAFDNRGNFIKNIFVNIKEPKSLIEDTDKNFYVCNGKEVIYFDKAENIIGLISEQIQNPADIYVKGDLIFISDSALHQILVFKKEPLK